MLLLFLISGQITAQPPLFESPVYIDHYSEEAIHQMVEFKIPASVILAQAIFESNCGTSALAKKSNNHFGIKCHIEWEGDTIIKDDDIANECFRKYNSVEESYTDHSMFLKTRSRYSNLFDLSILDYKNWCIGLKKSGYATYPTYAEELIRVIEQNKLFEMDRAEKMIDGILMTDQREKEIITNDYPIKYSASEILKSEALFVNEKDVQIGNIEMLIEKEKKEFKFTSFF